jgi:putative Mg2+ transporter-C (MgtC) family protein
VLVGIGTCAFTLVSAYGFAGVLDSDVRLDPSRIAAQIVSGIGFLGAGVIFKGRNMVRGLTTAATIWVTAAVGMACGAGMLSLATMLTALHLFTLFVVAPLIRQDPRQRPSQKLLRIAYQDGSGVLRDILGVASTHGVLELHRRLPKRFEDDERQCGWSRSTCKFEGKPTAAPPRRTQLMELPGVGTR